MSLTKQQYGIVALAVAVSYYASSAFASDSFNKFTKNNTAVEIHQVVPISETAIITDTPGPRKATTVVVRVVEPVGSGMVVSSVSDTTQYGAEHNKMVSSIQDRSKGTPVYYQKIEPEVVVRRR